MSEHDEAAAAACNHDVSDRTWAYYASALAIVDYLTINDVSAEVQRCSLDVIEFAVRDIADDD